MLNTSSPRHRQHFYAHPPRSRAHAQTELVLGEEGAAVLEHIMQTWRLESQSIEGLQDVSYTQVVQGIIALCCLQRVQRVRYGSKGLVLHRKAVLLKRASSLGGSGPARSPGDDETGDWKWQQEVHVNKGRDSADALRRSIHIASLCYSVLLDVVLGNGATSTKTLMGCRYQVCKVTPL